MAQLPMLADIPWMKDPHSEAKHMGAYAPRELIGHYYKNYGTGGFDEALRHRETAQRKGQASRAVEGNEWLNQFPSTQPDYNTPINVFAFTNKALDDNRLNITQDDLDLSGAASPEEFIRNFPNQAFGALNARRQSIEMPHGDGALGISVSGDDTPDYAGIFVDGLGASPIGEITMSSLEDALRAPDGSKAREVVEHEIGHSAWGNTYPYDYTEDILGGKEWAFKPQELDQWLADAKRKWVSSDKYKHDGPWNEEDSKDALKEYLQPNRPDKGSEIYHDIQNSKDFKKNFEKLTPLFLQRMKEVVQTDSPDKEVYA